MMLRGLAVALVLLLPVAACTQPAELEISEPWARASAGEADTAAVYMTITSPSDDRLIGASTPAAARTDLMTMNADGATMGMNSVTDIPLPANTPVSLDPSGLHVWLEGLHAPLTAGETFPLTLQFENAGEREITVSIIEPAAAPPMSDMDM